MTNDPTKGAAPLTSETPVLDIAGKEYKVRKLGLPQIGHLAHIFSAYSSLTSRAALLQSIDDPTVLGSFLLDACAIAFDEVVELLASIIGIDPGISDKRMAKLREEHDRRNAQRLEREETELEWMPPSNEGTIRDPNTFPLDSLVDLIEVVITHDDVIAFFDKFKRMLDKGILKKLAKPLKKRSTASKKGTGGKTSTSRAKG
jgi:hypothetical protein